jgi:hypothetical protein
MVARIGSDGGSSFASSRTAPAATALTVMP